MNLHANAKLGLAGRRELVLAIEAGASLRAAAAAFGVSPATAHTAGGIAGVTLQELRRCAIARRVRGGNRGG